MKRLTPLKKVEELLGCEKKRPPMGKGETMVNVYLDEEDFINRGEYERVLRENTEGASGEIAAEVVGRPIRATRGTYEDPPEGGYSEDVTVWVGGEDVWELLTEDSHTKFEQKHYEEASA